jgi:hypothetical protein
VSGSAGTLPAGSLTGKHVVVIMGAEGVTMNRALFRSIGALRNDDPASVMILSSSSDDEWAGQQARALQPSVRKGWGEGGGGGGSSAAPLLQVRPASLRALIAGTGIDLGALQSRYEGNLQVDAVEDMTVTMTVANESTSASAPNVVGILEGSDPLLKDEYVVFSGHMDHVGVGTPDENGDSIFNGADDDASGTVAVMEVAEAMASLAVAPKRSMIFLVVSGEEKGLWGSEYYADNPTVPVEQLVANLNTDMVGRNWPDTIVAIGKEHSDLGESMNRVNAEHPELNMTAIDDIWPEENFYGRSDHYNFAHKGVPILFFFNVFYLGVDIANAPEKPKWNPDSYQRIVSDGP